VKELTANPLECSLCKYIVQYVDAVIQNNKSEAAIEAALEKVCTILPHALNSSCVQFVQTFGPNLIKYIEKYETPNRVCAALKMCNGTNVTENISRKVYP
jgi:saposin